ncbi:MAG: hypothetical protein H0X45_10040 [Planctomycetes bacterium]|nr:hypothetical protein [Planctomycetota bacterium]
MLRRQIPRAALKRRPGLGKGVIGRLPFIAAGTEDRNHSAAVGAAQQLKALGWDVHLYEEAAVGHTVGPKMAAEFRAWYLREDPAQHATKWLAEAQRQLADKSVKDTLPPLRLLASVATLGVNSPEGAQARTLLESHEGESLQAYERAYEALRQRRFMDARRGFAEAGVLAKKARTPRIYLLAQARAIEVGEWQFCETAMTVRICNWSKRPIQCVLLAQDLQARSESELKDWKLDWMGEMVKGYAKEAQADPGDAKRRKPQVELAKARVAIYAGAWTAKALEKQRKELEEISATSAGLPEGTEARELLDRLPAAIEAKPKSKAKSGAGGKSEDDAAKADGVPGER